MRRSYLIPFAFIAVAALAQEEQEQSDVSAPQVVAFTVSDGSASSRELEAATGKLRAAYEQKPVLFLTINLATDGGKNQGSMLFFSLGLGPIWEECKKSAGQLVLVNLDTVTVLGKHGPKENLAAAVDKHLEKEEEGGGCGGCDEGSGD